MWSFGPCPTSSVSSFDLVVEVPKAIETAYSAPYPPFTQFPASIGFFTSPSTVNIFGGIWRVKFSVAFYNWDGTPHVYPIYRQQFKAMVSENHEGGNEYFNGFWPSNDVYHFAAYLSAYDSYIGTPSTVIGEDRPRPVDPFTGLPTDWVYYDFGCRHCNDSPTTIWAAVSAAEVIWASNAYAFQLTAHGEIFIP